MFLTVNAGSSSIKVELFDADLNGVLEGQVSEIGTPRASIRLGGDDVPCDAPDHDAAMGLILTRLSDLGHLVDSFDAAGHRIVQGGADLTEPARLTDEVIAKIEACVPLAPLHNPANLAGIYALARLAPELPQTASFDTAFHAQNPEVAITYPLPKVERDRGLRRYGFHGLSYASLVEKLSEHGLPERVLALHLGNGSSLCAIRGGRSVATSMGYSPISGPPMGTRSGDVDAALVLDLAERHGTDGALRILNKESGLKGLGGTNDMRTLLEDERAEARFAVEHFTYWVARQAGSLIVAMGGVDAIAFTGGIGEHAEPVRDMILARLDWLGAVPVHVVPADEERQIARDAQRVLGHA
ncbi:MAG: acetate kinase [Rhodobacterales bacterium]|nr:MAG: acetate kinase [Rhodobacterales bacterium]